MKKVSLLLTLSYFFALSLLAQDIIHPKNLRCEYLINPVGIDVKEPHLFWRSESTAKAQKQTAYQILVASTEAGLVSGEADLWDSGKIISDISTQVKYAGKPLNSDSKAFWKVKVWDKNGKESEWSPTAYWTIGLLNSADWKGKWIGLDMAMSGETPTANHPVMHGRMVRKESVIKKNVKSAMLYVTAAGLYEFHINGNKVGDAVLAPALSQTEKRMYYNAYDVSNLLKKGKNAFGGYVGAGRWTCLRPLQEATGEWASDKYKYTDTIPGYKPRFPKLLAQINIVYSDGSKEIIATDETWKLTGDGPITKNNEFDGEFYDATKEMVGWNQPGFSDKTWINASLVAVPTPVLSAENKEPIKVMETLKPVSVKEIKPGVFVYDMGQNMVGWVKLRVKGAKGTKVQMVFSELLKPDGSLYLANMRTAEVTDQYTLKGDVKGEEWEPRFVYHGFRYVEITGFPGTPDLSSIEGKVVYDAVETVGQFECSNPTMTQLHKNAYWGIRGNYRSMPTDCPQRDERLGWLGDRSIEAKGEAFIFRNIALYNKWLQDINDAQLESGSIPDVAPTHTGMVKSYSDGVVWPSCFVILPYAMHLQTGDRSVIERNYEAMKKFSNLCISQMKNGIIERNMFGDWCMPPEKLDMIWSQDPTRVTSGILLSSCYLYYDFTLLEMYAKMLGKKEDAAFFNNEAAKLKMKINVILFDAEKYMYANNTISSGIIPLGMGVVPEANREAVFRNTVQKLVIDLNTKIATGLIGGQWQMKALAENGRPDLSYTLATNKEYPSWGYQIKKGATTIWELWNGDKARPEMNSGNHVMLLGDVIIWMYENVAGINSDINAPGFKKIIMKPDLSERVSSAKASHNSMYGNIKSEWKLDGRRFDWKIEIPVNTSALVYVPAEIEGKILVNGQPYNTAEGLKFIKSENGKAVFEVGSGNYSFSSSEVMIPNPKEYVFSPTISPSDTVISDRNQTVQLKSNTEGATIHYTLDGSIPNGKSPVYTQPLNVEKTTTVKAIATKSGLPSSAVSITELEFFDAQMNGWNYKYYEGEWKMLPDFSKEKMLGSGISKGLMFDSINKREDFWGIVFSSNLLIDQEGEYTIYTTSDDGSRVLIDGKQVAIINGTHGPETGIGSITLTKGYHKIVVEYFEAIGGQSLDLAIQLKGGNRKSLPISKLYLTVPKK